jgi:hypothetical protein
LGLMAAAHPRRSSLTPNYRGSFPRVWGDYHMHALLFGSKILVCFTLNPMYPNQ